jgi:dienelactone hydrolase
MVGADVLLGLIYRLFPWRAPVSWRDRRRSRRNPRGAGRRDPATQIKLARSNAYTGLARFTGRSVDRLFLTALKRPHRYPGPGDLERVGEELGRAHALYRRGRLAAPSAFHGSPPPLESPSIEPAWHPSMRFEWLSFESGYTVPATDPASERWSGYDRNQIAHAWVARHSGPERPWLICLHGLGTGGPYADFAGFRTPMLHHELGLNLLMPVLPLHGPRKPPALPVASLLSYDLLDAFHGVSQAVWDTRRLIQWARAQGATKIGVYGLSMGAYVAALLSGLENVDLVIAGIPLCDIPDLFVHHAPVDQRQEAEDKGVLGVHTRELFELVSPLSVSPQTKVESRFIFAGSDDKVSTPEQAERLWEHWGQPDIRWFAGGHVSFFWSSEVAPFVDHRLHKAGFAVLDH